MHEFAVASEIIDHVLASTQKRGGKRVLSIQLEIGELTLLNTEQLLFWLQELLKGSMAEGAKVEIKVIQARISCEDCGYRGGFLKDQPHEVSPHALPDCPQCHSFNVKIKKGGECLLKRIRAVR